MNIKRFEEIEAWQHAKELAIEIYRLTNQGALAGDSTLRNQMRRAGVSAAGNIAEGFGRRTPGEFTQFLGVANGSVLEVQSHLWIARGARLVTPEQFDASYEKARVVSRLVGGFIHYLRSLRR